MSYEVVILSSAEREIDRLPTAVHARVSQKIISLEGNPRPRGTKKLSGREEYRLRLGHYRLLYTIDDKNKLVSVVAVGHRGEVYR